MKSGALKLGRDGGKPPLVGWRVDENGQEPVHVLGVEVAFDGEATHAALFKKLENGLRRFAILLVGEIHLHGVEEQRPVFGLEGDVAIAGENLIGDVQELLRRPMERLVLDSVNLSGSKELEPGK